MKLIPKVSEKDHIQGNPDAIVELVEYGDYQCSYCGRAFHIVKALQKRFGARLKFVFRNFPLFQIHPVAKIAAIATEAAGRQRKFWEMHDVIFENQKHLLPSSLKDYARQIDLQIEQFERDLENESLASKVEADYESGVQSGVEGTPAFFINRKKYNGAWDDEALSEYIQDKIIWLSKNTVQIL